jgi:hypothetical protein
MTGVTEPSDDGYYLEAWWVANPYLPTDHKFPLKYWAMDLLPACPLYQAITFSWEMTMRKYATAQYAAFALRDEVLVPPFKENLHWSITAPAKHVLATPIDYPETFNVEHQQNHLHWVYGYCLRVEGTMIQERFNSWFATRSQNGYEPHEWEFKVGDMREGFEIINNPWGDSPYTVNNRQKMTTTM